MSDHFFVTLKNRGLITIKGDDRVSFLQNLVTNDVTKASASNAVYACLLTPQGKFLHDFFVTADENALILECEGGARAKDLLNRLCSYRLRSKAVFEIAENIDVYVILDSQSALDSSYADTRNSLMGYRSTKKPNLSEKPYEIWDQQRIRLCIPDGSRDLIVGQSALDEGRIDELNGVDYQKGCYVGQELTARMHYRGLGKKHLYALQGTLPQPYETIVSEGKIIAEMRSKCGDIGLALIKDSELAALQTTGIKIIDKVK